MVHPDDHVISLIEAMVPTLLLLCKNHKNLRKNPKIISSWENAPVDGLDRTPRGINVKPKIE